MKKIMIRFWDLVIRFIKWYRKRNVLDMPNGICWTIGIYIVIAILIYFFEFLPKEILTKIVMALFLMMMLIANFLLEDKWVRRFTKDKYKTPIELLKNFSNGSYLYGVIFWFFTGEILIYSMIYTLLGIEVPFKEFTIINVMGFTFLWFTYHLYMNNELGSEEQKQSVIKLKLQLFAAIASTFSALLLLFDSWEMFKVMITMLALVFTWLRYIIDAEIEGRNRSENSDICGNNDMEQDGIEINV